MDYISACQHGCAFFLYHGNALHIRLCLKVFGAKRVISIFVKLSKLTLRHLLYLWKVQYMQVVTNFCIHFICNSTCQTSYDKKI